MSQRGNFKIEDKEILVAGLSGFEKNNDEGILIINQLLNSVSNFTVNWRCLNLNEDEIMRISYGYGEVSSNLALIIDMLIETLDLIFETKNVFESRERLEKMFLEKDDIETIVRRAETFKMMTEANNRNIRNNYLNIKERID
ncbi:MULTISPECIES: hypothetical protein [Staphylococcus]|uniref:hypothetical protein n=1 Tax=Staphylococcus TaxID=1279 RepID=UPI000539F357|nr:MULTISPECIES: hypothetical protein [Staphylococcus]QKK91601.1 hypothetical protein E3306_14600 [Staphylococcus aureus]WEK86481.1 hypothetical protein P1A14_14010 [Staphylococcus aureus]HAR3090350.1 hypothetical protein [Staphylococcus aureus]